MCVVHHAADHVARTIIELQIGSHRAHIQCMNLAPAEALIDGLAGDAARAGALSRIDLDAPTTEANLHFFEFARGP